MADLATLMLDFAALFTSLAGLFLIMRHRTLLRGRMASNWIVAGFIFLSTILSIHCLVDLMNVEMPWLDAGIHFVWSVVFTAGLIVIVRFSKLLRGYFSLSIPSFQSIAKRLTTMYSPSAARAILYAAAKEAGHDDAARLMKEHLLMDEAFILWFVRICENLGWGRYEPGSIRIGEELTLRVYDCFESAGITKTGSPAPICVCFQSGYFAGVAKALRPNMECEAKETKCPRLGHPYCEFTITFSEPPKGA